ncbi:MAG: hypothetical protein PW788_02920 [Micavibrio sp.]|nr:hypothetical protein [Micavibrio sp.]
MSYINIAKDDTRPLFVEASDVTGVHINKGADGKTEFTVYNSAGQLAWVDAAGWNLDPADAIEKLRAAGAPLVQFPVRWPADNDTLKEYDHYINPEAVTYLTVSAEDKTGNYGTIVGVRGIGREESYGTKPEELEELLNAVKAVKALQTYAPDEAHARWSRASALYIDPASVTQVRDDGYQVNVWFEGSGSLDVQVKRHDVNEISNDIFNGGEDKRNLREIFAEATSKAHTLDTSARVSFSKAVASVNTSMIDMSTPERSSFINRALIGFVSFHDDERSGRKSIHIHSQKSASNPYPDSISFSYATNEDRNAAFQDLQEKLKTHAAAPKRKGLGKLNP